MGIVFVDGMPLSPFVRQELAGISVNERGERVQFHSDGGLRVLVSEDGPHEAGRFLDDAPEGGILIVSARSQLAPGSALRALLASAQLPSRRIALFCTHAWSPDDAALVSSLGVQCYSMVEISREGLTDMTDAVMAFVRQWPAFLLVIDLDVLDPAFAPGLAGPVPGGLSSRELLYIAQRLRLIKTLAGVEVIARVDVADTATAGILARLLAELR
ncbi:TPA: arginase family protein [Candidatus Woesearchaeota archaeon]|nr:arginase family protein [Candidatus Woesearchaeota archaeon]